MDGLEQLLRVNKYYEDKKRLYEAVDDEENKPKSSMNSTSKNKKLSADALKNGDTEEAQKASNNIKDKAKRDYAKMKIKRKKQMEKQKQEQQKKAVKESKSEYD